MRRPFLLVLALVPAVCAALSGCGPGDKVTGEAAAARAGSALPGSFRLDPLPVQQAKAYPETTTGIFISLADFEGAPGGGQGHEQVKHFRIDPPQEGAERKFAVNITRTGVGALEVNLPAGSELVFTSPHLRDFSGYKLLSMAIYSRAVRDDLEVALVGGQATWRSHRTLVRPGWNNVLIDIQHLSDLGGFDIRSVKEVRIGHADAAGAVWFNLDDIMLVDNARTIRPTPPGTVLRKCGLDYFLKQPGQAGESALRQSPDGLWRWDALQPKVQLSSPGRELGGPGEDLERMGARRVGQVDLVEHNRLRVRLANTWYFPGRSGEWASQAVRRIEWEHTFYGDGRQVIQGMLNNAGGQEIGQVEVLLPLRAAWAGGEYSDRFLLRDLAGEVGRWRMLIPPPGPAGEATAAGYLRPGRLEAAIAAQGTFAAGDADRDGFDESQGCYFLAARAGHCRFTIIPPKGGLLGPTFLVAGPWSGPVHVSSEGLALPAVAEGTGGAVATVLFELPGRLDRPRAVEVTGQPAPRQGG